MQKQAECDKHWRCIYGLVTTPETSQKQGRKHAKIT